MKNYKKILVLLVLVATALLLTSCGKKEDKTFQHYIYDLNPEELVVEELDDSNHLESFTLHQVLYNGELASQAVLNASKYELYDIDGVLTTDLSAAVKKIYFYFDIEVVQYLKGTNLDEKFIYVDYVDYDKGKYTRNGAVLTNSYLFEGQDLVFYEITANGIEEINASDITFTGFPTGDDLFLDGKKGYKKQFNAVVNGKLLDNTTFEMNIRLYATNTPIHHKAATFWNWVFLKMPIAYLMAFIGKLFNNSFAMAILITTIIIRTLAWPIYAKTNDMTMKMALAQPDLDKLQRKYAGKKDPESQQKMQIEMMQIYKKHKINFFGCLLPFLQMPIFLAMFQVVREITIPGGQFYENVKNTKFLLTDLTSDGMIAKIIFTALVAVTMFALQKISQIKPSYAKTAPKSNNPQADQQQQTMKMVSFIMIFMMVMTAFLSPGLALSYYWIIGNIYSMSQTYFNRFMNEKKYKKLEEEKLYGRSREIIDAKFKEKGDN